MLSTMKLSFTYHALDRIQERYPEVSAASIAQELSDPNNWLSTEFDVLSGGNKRDGVKMRVALRADERLMKAVVIKKVEQNRPTLVILSVGPA